MTCVVLLIRMSRELGFSDAEARSRRNNLIFRGIAETPGDDDLCAGLVKELIRKELHLDINPYIQRAHRLGNPIARGRIGRRWAANRPTPRPIIVCFRDYEDVESIIGNAYKLANSNLGISRDYPKEIVDARAELWPLYKSEKQKYAKGKVFIRFPAQLVVNGRIAVDKFPDWRSVLNGSRNKSCTEGALPSTDRGAMKPGTSSSRLRSSRDASRDTARSETDDESRDVAMQMDNDQRSQASGQGSEQAVSEMNQRGTIDMQNQTPYEAAMDRLLAQFESIQGSQHSSTSRERSSSVPPSRDKLNERVQKPANANVPSDPDVAK